jgi:hypothetical protein
MLNNVKENYKKGTYQHAGNRTELAEQLYTDLQQASKDPHLRIHYDPQLAGFIETPMPDSMRQQLRKKGVNAALENNFAFKKTEILQGNIGYLRLDGFWEFVEEGKPTLDAAFKFVSNCKTLIIDMRYNWGGSPEMVLQTQSYFFTEKTRMNDIIDRNNDTVKRWADPATTSFKLGMPIYILTSRNTFSGAEDFTYDLQQVKRATVVGDTTGGGAHPTADFSIGQGFVVNIPTHRSPNVISKTDWEGTGVWPDVAVQSALALAKAQVLIFTELLAKAKDEEEKHLFQWDLNSIENKEQLAKQLQKEGVKIAKGTLLKYCGEYEASDPNDRITSIAVILKGNQLYRHLNNGVEDVCLVPISATKFVFDDESARTLEFETDKHGEIADLILSNQRGNFTMRKK